MTTPPDLRPLKDYIKQLSVKSNIKNKNILFQIHKNNQAHIIFNRPKLMNAFSFDMYFLFTSYLQKANQMSDIKYIVIKGSGGNFSSGNDLNNFANQELQSLDVENLAKTMADILSELTEVIVKSKKPIFAVIQGRTVGFAFTQLALYDKVFAVQKSLLMAPLVKIAQGPEMASSYLFPKIFGQALAQQLIIKGRPVKPEQLQKYNFLQTYKNVMEANQALDKHLQELDSLDWASYVEARRLMRLADRDRILEANRNQCENLVERWKNPELPVLMLRYLSNKKERPKL